MLAGVPRCVEEGVLTDRVQFSSMVRVKLEVLEALLGHARFRRDVLANTRAVTSNVRGQIQPGLIRLRIDLLRDAARDPKKFLRDHTMIEVGGHLLRLPIFGDLTKPALRATRAENLKVNELLERFPRVVFLF